MKLGIDFGTTNSAVAVVDDQGRARILELVEGQRTQRTVIHSDLEGNITFGNAAFDRYLAADLRGRFLRSLKAFLPQDVPPTRIGRVTMSFVELVARFLTYLAEEAERVAGEPIDAVVVGRPVVFHADPDKDAYALAQLERAIAVSGLPRPVLQLEPVAAALRYEATLTRDRTVLVGNFGGGTADFAVLQVGPGQQGRGLERVLGTSGVAKAGNVLDGRFLDAFVLDHLGRGLMWTPRGKAPQAWNPGVHRHLAQLYDIHRLREPRLAAYLDDVEQRASDPVPVERLRRLVFDDLGYPMADAVERTKRAYQHEEVPTFRFDSYFSPRLDFDTPAPIGAFREASSAVLAAYEAAIDEVLLEAGLDEGGIDDVFLTGGTSQLPFIFGLFAARFGAERVQGGDAFTSVCEGLAVSRSRASTPGP